MPVNGKSSLQRAITTGTRATGVDLSTFRDAAIARVAERKRTESPLFPVTGGGARISGGVEPGHVGIDIAAALGTPVFAPVSGIISREQKSDVGYGRAVWMTDPRTNLEITLGHLLDEIVSVGQAVTRGELIGYVGSTGSSTGPHLHFEVGQVGAQPFYGARSEAGAVDPWTWLGIEPFTGAVAGIGDRSGTVISSPPITRAVPAAGISAPPIRQISRPLSPTKSPAVFQAFTEIGETPASAGRVSQAERWARNVGAEKEADAIAKAGENGGSLEDRLTNFAKRSGYILAGVVICLVGFVLLAGSYKNELSQTAGSVVKAAL